MYKIKKTGALLEYGHSTSKDDAKENGLVMSKKLALTGWGEGDVDPFWRPQSATLDLGLGFTASVTRDLAWDWVIRFGDREMANGGGAKTMNDAKDRVMAKVDELKLDERKGEDNV